jgi:hypothetical protein
VVLYIGSFIGALLGLIIVIPRVDRLGFNCRRWAFVIVAGSWLVGAGY